VGALYLAALVVGVGIIGLQFLMPGSGDHDVHVDAGGGHDIAHDGHDQIASGAMAVVLSVRFWTYALLAFGLVGSALHFTALGGAATPIAAAVFGVVSGLLASLAFRALSRTAISSSAEPSEIVGAVGRVLLDIAPGQNGKIRLEMRGQTVDYVARTEHDALAQGAAVLVVGLRDSVVLVRPAPPEMVEKT
jgi:membrane protein implicated in regulation of membrane protease activity